MSTARRKRRLIDAGGVAAMAALSVAAYLLVVEPSWRAQQRLDAERSESARAESQAEKAAADLADANRQLAQLERELDTMAVELRAPGSINRQIDRLTGLADRSGVKLTRIYPESAWGNQWFTAVPITMTGTGTFASAAEFVHRVLIECADVSVRGLKLTAQPSGVERGGTTSTTPRTAKSEKADAQPQAPAAMEVEFVWYAAPEGTAGVDTTK